MLFLTPQKAMEWRTSCLLFYQPLCSFTLVRLTPYMLSHFEKISTFTSLLNTEITQLLKIFPMEDRGKCTLAISMKCDVYLEKCEKCWINQSAVYSGNSSGNDQSLIMSWKSRKQFVTNYDISLINGVPTIYANSFTNQTPGIQLILTKI